MTDALGPNIVDLDGSPHVILSTLTIFMLPRDGVEQSHHSVTMAQHMQLPLSDDYPWSGSLTMTVMHPSFHLHSCSCKVQVHEY